MHERKSVSACTKERNVSSTDGDADRLGVIDDKGRYLHANQILVLLYYYLLKYKDWQGPCVRNRTASPHFLRDGCSGKSGRIL